MICPRCQGELFESVKQGVTIDHCSGCKGIWLDQGELAKIIAHMKQVESSLDAEFRSRPNGGNPGNHMTGLMRTGVMTSNTLKRNRALKNSLTSSIRRQRPASGR